MYDEECVHKARELGRPDLVSITQLQVGAWPGEGVVGLGRCMVLGGRVTVRGRGRRGGGVPALGKLGRTPGVLAHAAGMWVGWVGLASCG